MEVVNCIPTYMPIRMFVNILFIKGTEDNTCPLLQEEQTYTFCYIHTGILYSSEKEQITVKCSNTIFPSGT